MKSKQRILGKLLQQLKQAWRVARDKVKQPTQVRLVASLAEQYLDQIYSMIL